MIPLMMFLLPSQDVPAPRALQLLSLRQPDPADWHGLDWIE